MVVSEFHYNTYSAYKAYSTPEVRPKHIARLDCEVWEPGEFQKEHAILEIGCGTGLFLAYLAEKKAVDFRGIDFDEAVYAFVPENIRDRVEIKEAFVFLGEAQERGDTYDRIVMFDVLEHFNIDDGCNLLRKVRAMLRLGGKVIIKVPNAGSPWGQQFQYGDLTHQTHYTPDSLVQQAIAAGFVCKTTYPHKLGSPARQWWDTIIHGFLDHVLTSPPKIWDGNFYGILLPSEK